MPVNPTLEIILNPGILVTKPPIQAPVTTTWSGQLQSHPTCSPSFPFDSSVKSPPNSQNCLLEIKSDDVTLLLRTVQGPLCPKGPPMPSCLGALALVPSSAQPVPPLVSIPPWQTSVLSAPLRGFPTSCLSTL